MSSVMGGDADFVNRQRLGAGSLVRPGPTRPATGWAGFGSGVASGIRPMQPNPAGKPMINPMAPQGPSGGVPATVTPGGAPTAPQSGGGGPAIAPQAPETPYDKYINSPDLTKSGVDVMKGYIAETDPQYQADIRSAMQAAAAGGRLGSGMTTEQLIQDPYGSSGLALNRGKNIAALAQQLAGSLAPAEQSAEASKVALQDALLNSSFGRQAGAAQLGMAGAGTLAGEAGQAGAGAGTLLSNVALQNALAKMYGTRAPGAV